MLMDREDWNQRYAGSDLVWSAEANRFLMEEASDLRPGRALDLGAGEGRNAIWLAKRGWRVTAVDFSEVGLRKAQEIARSGGADVDWVEADLRTYSPEQRTFDLVILMYIHFPAMDRRALVRAAAAAVAEGGTLLVVGHDRSNLERGFGGPQDPSILFGPEDLTADVAGLEGLHVVRAERVLRPVIAEDGEHTAVDALVRVRRGDGERP